MKKNQGWVTWGMIVILYLISYVYFGIKGIIVILAIDLFIMGFGIVYNKITMRIISFRLKQIDKSIKKCHKDIQKIYIDDYIEACQDDDIAKGIKSLEGWVASCPHRTNRCVNKPNCLLCEDEFGWYIVFRDEFGMDLKKEDKDDE